MGCASSSPLVEGGKNLVEAAKETANEAVTKGEQAFHDVGESAKDGIETVKDTMSNAFTTAENSVGNVVGKIGETFSFTTSQAKEEINNLDVMKDELINNASDATAEAVSEAETVLASEADHVKEMAMDNTADMFETAHNMANDASTKFEDIKKEAMDIKDDVIDSVHIEEIDQSFDMLGDSVTKVENKVQEVLKSTPDSSPTKEIKKEEGPPTFWEAAADAIILRRTVKSMHIEVPDNERMFPIADYENEDTVKQKDISDDLIISDLEK